MLLIANGILALPLVISQPSAIRIIPASIEWIFFEDICPTIASKVSDLIPELQGRFPILVELHSLTKKDFVEILTTPQNAITIQYATLLKVDGVDLKFTEDAIESIAGISEDMNNTREDIGARRLHTVMENLIEDISFEAGGETEKEIIIDKAYVAEKLGGENKSKDLKKYIL